MVRDILLEPVWIIMPLQWAHKVCNYGLIQWHGQNIDLPSQ